MHQSSFQRMQRFAEFIQGRFHGGPVHVLDVGSAGINGTYRDLFQFPGAHYTGVDVTAGPNVDVVLKDPYEWSEVADDSFDVVISGQALEHVEFPWLSMAQIRRKLRVGGTACVIVPSRGPEHRYPVDCYRYYPDGLRALCRYAGLRVIEADYHRGPSGFQDGSDQWGDCYCIATRDAAEATAPVPAAPAAAPASAPATQINRHAFNPIKRIHSASYFAHPREEVLRIMDRVLAATLQPAAAAPRNGPPALRALELGCAGGATGQALRNRYHAHVTGLEFDESAATIARALLDAVYTMDIERQDAASLRSLDLRPGSFDLLLALDVLEHLYDPWEVLCRYNELLKPGGHVVVSLPNIQNISILVGLSEGLWPYEEAGILDATHLRFFTLPTAQQLLTGAGLKILDIVPVFNPQLDTSRLRDQNNTISFNRLSLNGLSREQVYTFYAYQYILVAQKPLS